MTNIITTGLTKYMVAVVGNTAKSTINVSYKTIVEVLMKVHFKIIARKSVTFVRNQIVGQLDTPLMSKKRYITSFVKVQEMSKIIRLLQPTSKAS